MALISSMRALFCRAFLPNPASIIVWNAIFEVYLSSNGMMGIVWKIKKKMLLSVLIYSVI